MNHTKKCREKLFIFLQPNKQMIYKYFVGRKYIFTVSGNVQLEQPVVVHSARSCRRG